MRLKSSCNMEQNCVPAECDSSTTPCGSGSSLPVLWFFIMRGNQRCPCVIFISMGMSGWSCSVSVLPMKTTLRLPFSQKIMVLEANSAQSPSSRLTTEEAMRSTWGGGERIGACTTGVSPLTLSISFVGAVSSWGMERSACWRKR